MVRGSAAEAGRLIPLLPRTKITMPKTESVLISVSIVVTAPVSETLAEGKVLDPLQVEFLRAVAERLRSSVSALEQEPWFEQDAGVCFHYLSPQNGAVEKNVGRCARCGRWTSDCESPNFQELLMIGYTVAGELVCDECLHFADAPISSESTDF